MSRQTAIAGDATRRVRSRSPRVRRPVRSCSTRGSRWTVPELRKTHRTRFPQLLGRRTERAAHNGPQAFFFWGLEESKTRTATMTLVTQGG
jgi:hypothetical protein